MSDTDHSSISGQLLTAAVDEAQTGQRLDVFLTAALSGFSRARVQGLIASGAVSRGSETIGDANKRVKPGEEYNVAVPPPVPAIPQGQNIPLNVVYEDDDLIVIDKPAGMVVHPAAGNPDGTLVNALIAHCGESLQGVGGELRPGIVHRIDKDTSGLLIAAKNERTMRSLGKQFAAHAIERVYHAIIWGAPRLGSGVVEGDIGRNPHDRKRMAIVRAGGKHARTHYRVVERFGTSKRIIAALVECRLETGRTHQIRVHLTHLGHPLIGDATYGKARQPPRPKTPEEERAFAAAANFPRQALHAAVLGFHHPGLDRPLRFESAWPADLSALLGTLRALPNDQS